MHGLVEYVQALVPKRWLLQNSRSLQGSRMRMLITWIHGIVNDSHGFSDVDVRPYQACLGMAWPGPWNAHGGARPIHAGGIHASAIGLHCAAVA